MFFILSGPVNLEYEVIAIHPYAGKHLSNDRITSRKTWFFCFNYVRNDQWQFHRTWKRICSLQSTAQMKS